MNVLFVVPYMPNLIRIRPINIIKHLTAIGHQVTVVTLAQNKAEQQDAVALEEFCKRVVYEPLTRQHTIQNVLRTLPSKKPLQSAYCWQPDLAERLTELVSTEKFDVAHVEHLRGSRFGQHLKQVQPNLPVVWDSVDSISHLFAAAAKESPSWRSRLMTRFELSRTRKHEGELTAAFDQVIVTSRQDALSLAALAQNAGVAPSPITVVANGVDTTYFRPNNQLKRTPNSLVLSGKMSYHANEAMALHLVENILPLVWQNKPEVTLTIVGKDPTGPVKKLGEHPKITITNTVPDIRPYLQVAALAVAPLVYGAGIQNKLLEAMACGTPVITTSRGVEALSAEPNRDLMVADTPQKFARHIIDLLNDDPRRLAIGKAGGAYVREAHDWHAVAQQLTNLYHESRQRNDNQHRIPV